MADGYVGLPVVITRNDASEVRGRIEAVDTANLTLRLSNVTLTHTGEHFPSLIVPGDTIRDLDLKSPQPLHSVPVAAPSAAAPSTARAAPSAERTTSAKFYTDAYQDPAIVMASPVLHQAPRGKSHELPSDPAILSMAQATPVSKVIYTHEAPRSTVAEHGTPQSPSYVNTKDDSRYMADTSALETEDDSQLDTAFSDTPGRQRQRSAKSVHGKRMDRRTNRQHAWQNEQVDSFKDEEYDFQAALDKFDKQKVFDEIRRGDTTLPEELLVSHNRVKRNFDYTENVLDSIPGSQRPVTAAKKPDVRPASVMSSQLQPPSSPTTRKTDSRPAAGAFTGFYLEQDTKALQAITPVQMNDAIDLCNKRLGPSLISIAEEAGRSVAEHALSLIYGSLDKHDVTPVVVILAGMHRTGLIATIAGRIMSNMSARIVLVTTGSEPEDPLLAQEIGYFKNAGGRVVHDIEKRAAAFSVPPGLVIDGLLGPDQTLEDIWEPREEQRARELISWVRGLDAQVLSIDVPSGLSGHTGEPCVSDSDGLEAEQAYIAADVVIVTGLPRLGLLRAQAAGRGARRQVLLANVSIPWRMVMENWRRREKHGDFTSAGGRIRVRGTRLLVKTQW